MANYFEDLVESKLLQLHTAYLARVLSVEEKTATVQPLTMIKQIGKDGKLQAPIPNTPILSCAGTLKKGNVVLCVCCERDITRAKNNEISIPTYRRHSLSDSIIIGVLGNSNSPIIDGSNYLKKAVVTALPTANIDTNTIYIVAENNFITNNKYIEYMYINSNWEVIGSAGLTDYLTKDDVSELTNSEIDTVCT